MIDSLTNEKVKYVRSLYRRTVRQRERSFVIEGVRLVEEAVDAGVILTLVIYDAEALCATERGQLLLEKLGKGTGNAYPATAKVVESISDTVSPQGVVASGPFLSWELPVIGEGSLVLVTDGIRDPGNLGTILRSAEAGGACCVLLTTDTVDLYNPKVMRAAMGAHFRLPSFSDLGWDEIRQLLKGVEQTLVTEAQGGRAYYDVDWRKRSGLIVGNEARGAGGAARELATESISIPMEGRAESLNAAVAAGIVLFEALRQRTELCDSSS